jgi:hypothetical protein
MSMKFFGTAILVFAVSLAATTDTYAYECRGPLSDAQASGFDFFFSPAYSPGLRHVGGRVEPKNMKKLVTRIELARLTVANALVSASATLTDAQARVLKGWLNERAQESVPGWLSTAIGIVAPAAWIGVSADVLLQLVNQSGDAGRITLANIAGTVSAGGEVAILHRIVSDTGAATAYVWIYTYAATLNNRRQVFVLRTCAADTVVN